MNSPSGDTLYGQPLPDNLNDLSVLTFDIVNAGLPARGTVTATIKDARGWNLLSADVQPPSTSTTFGFRWSERWPEGLLNPDYSVSFDVDLPGYTVVSSTSAFLSISGWFEYAEDVEITDNSDLVFWPSGNPVPLGTLSANERIFQNNSNDAMGAAHSSLIPEVTIQSNRRNIMGVFAGTITVAPIPEPSSALLVGTVFVFGLARYRRREA